VDGLDPMGEYRGNGEGHSDSRGHAEEDQARGWCRLTE